MVTIDRERLISEKQYNKANAESARLPKEAMLLRDIFKFTYDSNRILNPDLPIAKEELQPLRYYAVLQHV